MNIHEYQAKALLAKHGVAVPRGQVAYTAQEAEEAAQALNGRLWVVKAQIHAGGRGKGGVRVVKSSEDVRDNAGEMLGATLVTKQTGPQGKEVKRVYIEEGCDIGRELYLSVLIDRATSRITVIASTEGGMDIEEVAAKTPEKILTVPIDPAAGMQGFHARRIAFALGLSGRQVGGAVKLLLAIYQAFCDLDASLIEVNPLVVRLEGTNVALGKTILADSGLAIDSADNLADAAEKIVRAVKEAA